VFGQAGFSLDAGFLLDLSGLGPHAHRLFKRGALSWGAKLMLAPISRWGVGLAGDGPSEEAEGVDGATEVATTRGGDGEDHLSDCVEG